MIAAAQLLRAYIGYKKARDYYDSAADQYVHAADTPQPTAVSAAAETSEPAAQQAEQPAQAASAPAEQTEAPRSLTSAQAHIVCPISVDFDALQQANVQVIGWIYCEGLPINYPVVQAEDNDYYLHRKPDRTEGESGAIFMDAANRNSFQDDISILYGHNMKDGSMFAKLINYSSQAYYNSHPVMWLLTPGQNYRVDLFSCLSTLAGDWPYTIRFSKDADKEAYLARAKGESMFTSSVEPTAADQLLLLSTCHYSYNDERYVVLGVLTPAE